jgi:membrane-bound lytic murein transglycosylase D
MEIHRVRRRARPVPCPGRAALFAFALCAALLPALAGAQDPAPAPAGDSPLAVAPATVSLAAPEPAAPAVAPAAEGTPPQSGPAPLAATPAEVAAIGPVAPAAEGGANALADALVAPSPQAAPPDADLWERIRRGFAMPDLETKRAQSATRWYAAQPDYMVRMSSRASMYLFHIVEEIEKRGMPTELALLPFVESAMQPEAVSWAKAAGLWQFIPSTGRLYSLEQNLWKDERLGVTESTRAALDYLQKLHAEFGDWQLALAAYNCGEAGVERALSRARKAKKSVAYKDLRLPNETQYYVPKLQAIKNIIADPARYGIALPAIRNEPYFTAVRSSRDMDVLTAARLADMPVDDFRALNPAFNRPIIVGISSPTVLVPADHAGTFTANLAAWEATGQPLTSWTAVRLGGGESLKEVADRAGISEAQLREANHIPPRYRPAVGSTLLVPRDETMGSDIAAELVDASMAVVPESANLHQVTYRVRRGDSLASVARRWRVQEGDILAWNNLHGSTLFAGQRLVLTVPRAAPAVAKSQKGAAKPAASTASATHGASPAASSRM